MHTDVPNDASKDFGTLTLDRFEEMHPGAKLTIGAASGTGKDSGKPWKNSTLKRRAPG